MQGIPLLHANSLTRSSTMQDRRKAYMNIWASSMTILNNPRIPAIPPNEPHSSSTVSYALPHPTSITEELVAKGFIPDAAELLSKAYLQHAMASKQIHEQYLNAVLRRIEGQSDSPSPTLLIFEAYKAQFHSRLAYWFDQTLLAYQSWLHGQRSNSTAANSSQYVGPVRERPKIFTSVNIYRQCLSPRLNLLQEALQLLEQAFGADPYPERTDKARLAEEAGIEYKQVHVWVGRNLFARSNCRRYNITHIISFKTVAIDRKKMVNC